MQTVQHALALQRSTLTFSPLKLSHFLYTPAAYPSLRALLDTLPVPPHSFNLYNRGRVQIIKQAMRDLPILYNSIGSEWNDNSIVYLLLAGMHQMPGTAHIGMFMKCIEIMGTEQQAKEYLEKCGRYEVVGCYAQTELGHGSDVASLMTTATYHESSGQFVLDNSFDIKAIKYWPGDMGLIATHALVFAQLVIKGQGYGVHAFIVKIRDEKLNLMPGVDAGDIGPKIGFVSKDNGYLILNKVAVPRENMLSRYVSVSQKGEIQIKGNPKISYATMMQIRRYISCSLPKIYANAITIATRYSIFRRQFKNMAKQEIKIMDYQLQQQKIIDRVAQYYAITVAGNSISKLCKLNTEKVTKNQDFSLMAQTHACLCLGKPFFSELAYDGMQICRKACGGHGFSHYSGFPSLINQYAANLTHEGENTVLYLQVARYLMKSYTTYIENKQSLGASVKYIESYDYLMNKKCQVADSNQWSLQDIRILLAQSICYLLSASAQKLNSKNPEQGLSDKDIMNRTIGINLKQMAILHAGYYTFDNFKRAVTKQKDQRIKQIVTNLCLLFGVNFLLAHATPAIQGSFITSDQMRSLMDLKQTLLRKLRPDLIGLVDGFGIPEKYIRSALISGNPYENYLSLARENQINHERLQSVDVVKSVKNYIKNPNPSL